MANLVDICSNGLERTLPVIDDPFKADRLFGMLQQSLPIRATLTSNLAKLLQRRSPDVRLPRQCEITEVHYAGDEGGIVCRLDFGLPDANDGYIASLTHLTIDRGSPLSRDIADYRKRRVKRLRRDGVSL